MHVLLFSCITADSALADKMRGSMDVHLVVTSNRAVAEKPRDVLCLSVASFNSTIPGAHFSIVCDFSFRYTIAYNSIMFRSLRPSRPRWL